MYDRYDGGVRTTVVKKQFEINDCMEILSCIYFHMNLIQFRMSKTEL